MVFFKIVYVAFKFIKIYFNNLIFLDKKYNNFKLYILDSIFFCIEEEGKVFLLDIFLLEQS